MSEPEQISARNSDGSWTVDMWGVSYAAPMNDLREHPPMALFRYVQAATNYKDEKQAERHAVRRDTGNLDVRLLRVTVAKWTPPPFAPKRGERVRGIDAHGTEWEAPYFCAGDAFLDGAAAHHYLGTERHNIEVVSVHPLGSR